MSHWVKLSLKLATQDSQDLLDTQVSVAEVAWGGLQSNFSKMGFPAEIVNHHYYTPVIISTVF